VSKSLLLPNLLLLLVLAFATPAQQVPFFPQPPSARLVPFDRLPADQLTVTPPTALVRGAPGEMRVLAPQCQAAAPTAETRQRIVDIAVQEWGFFGFPIVDQTIVDDEDDAPRPRGRGRRGQGDPVEANRVASSIGGYWAATPDGAWIVDRQNDRWQSGSRTSRWRDPWSAAFVSWVMCEGGLGDSAEFRRAIAHHTYIDQAIRARDGRAPGAAYVAYDTGEKPVEPGDLLCSSRRPVYHSIAERRRQMGQGASSHCDIVVKVDAAEHRFLTVGGNVGGRVSLKIMPTTTRNGVETPVSSRRVIFAHLKLKADPVAADALDQTPTMKALGCAVGTPSPNQALAIGLTAGRVAAKSC